MPVYVCIGRIRGKKQLVTDFLGVVNFCKKFRAVIWDLKLQSLTKVLRTINMSHWKIVSCLDNINTSHSYFLIYPVVMCET